MFAHGARDPNWAKPFWTLRAAITDRLVGRPKVAQVELAFLEHMQPSLLQAADVLVAAGFSNMLVLPVFMGEGGHLKKDLPRLIEAIKIAHPQCVIEVTSSVGEQPGVIAAITQFACDSL